jgi:ferredoxin
MSATRLQALAYLGYRAILAHPLKRLRRRGTGLERFLGSYAGEGLVPIPAEELAIGVEASACIACGLCEVGCDLSGAAPAIRALGVEAAFRLYSRSTAELPHAADALRACEGCAVCDRLCPTGVPISRIVRHLRARISEGPGPEERSGG